MSSENEGDKHLLMDGSNVNRDDKGRFIDTHDDEDHFY